MQRSFFIGHFSKGAQGIVERGVVWVCNTYILTYLSQRSSSRQHLKDIQHIQSANTCTKVEWNLR